MSRIRRLWRRILPATPQPVILMYHRVADVAHDPWGLAITPSRFAAQLEALRDVRVPMPMREFANRLDRGTLPARAVAVTFDDGYADNLRHAKPALERVGIPATVFLTTGMLGRREEFWWDELARLILSRREPADGALRIAGQTVRVLLPHLANDAPHDTGWRAWDPPRSPRQELYLDIWRLLRGMAVEDREGVMRPLRQLLDGGAPDAEALPLQREDVRRLRDGGCIDIGAHTRTHRPLSALSPDELRDEVDGSRIDCEVIAGAIEGLTYPHGDRDDQVKSTTRASGFAWACSTAQSVVNRKQFDLFDLPRLQVLNWEQEEFVRQLRFSSGAM